MTTETVTTEAVTTDAGTVATTTRPAARRRAAGSRGDVVPVLAVVAAIIALWYAGAVLLNAPLASDAFSRQDRSPTALGLVAATLAINRPVLPAPHQIAVELWNSTALQPVTSRRSLVYHAWVTLSATLLGFAVGALSGILLAAAIFHAASLEKGLMPWLIASQTIPIVALAPMIIVVLTAVHVTGLIPRALISTCLSLVPVTVGVVTGLRSPDPVHLDLMRTCNASRWQTFLALRLPSAVPFLFASLKVAIAASLVGAIVGELPTGASAGLGARLLAGSYDGETVQIWAALAAAAILAAALLALAGAADRVVRRRMGTAR